MKGALALEHPAFAIFDPPVRARLATLDRFPEPSELRDLALGQGGATEPWFDFEPEDTRRVRELGGFDRFIALTRRIPTRRACWHDLLGALIWLHFPRLKTAIHQAQLAAEGSRRGARENAATHLDESGVLVLSSEPRVFQQLAELNWPEVFWHQRQALLGSTRFLCFGHGLLDALRVPHPKLMGMAWFVRVSAAQLKLGAGELRALLDGSLSEHLPRFLVEPARLQPLPVLGIPNWSAGQSAAFYDDTQYFRRARQRLRASSAPAFVELG